LSDFDAREANRVLVDDVLRQHASKVRDYADLESRFERVGLMVAPLRSVSDLAATPWARDRGAFHDLGGGVNVPTAPWRSDRATIGVRNPAAARGGHTDEVLRELLGLDGDTIAQMRRDHICE
jgi:crotonobetainyl-CoA:carnitine CoA-transferase CaiB-like acyl-CoA transferase